MASLKEDLYRTKVNFMHNCHVYDPMLAGIKALSGRALPDTGVSGTNFEPGCTEWKAVRTS